MGKGGASSSSRCWAHGCESNRVSTPNYRFHRFPKQLDVCLDWVKRSGNSCLIANSPRQLQTIRALCSKHFSADQYMVRGNIHSSLIPNARPSIFNHPPIPDHCVPTSFLSPSHPSLENISPVRIAVPVLQPICVPVSEVSEEVTSTPVDSSQVSSSTPVCPNPCLKRKVLCDLDLSSNIDSAPKRKCVEFSASTPFPSKQPTCRLLFSDDSGVSSSASTPNNSSSQTPAPKKAARKSVSTKYRTVLGSYNLVRSDITPRKKAVIEDNRRLLREVAALRRSLEAVKDNKKALEKLSNGPLISRLREKMKTEEAALVMEMQIANHGRKRNVWTLPRKH